MRDSLLRTKQFSRRSFLLGSGKLTLLSVLGMRAYYLQVVEGSRYQTLADGNRVRLQPIIPSRGRILDRNGHVLAEGKDEFGSCATSSTTHQSQDRQNNHVDIDQRP